jgi:thiol:disulfide interchange protein DsbA
MLRRTFAAIGLLLAAPALKAAGDHGSEGPFSTLQRQLPTDAPGKVEVIEFFWYGCPHCAKIEPFIEAWEKKLPPDVAFRREHVVWSARPETAVHARIFATLRTMGLVAQHQQSVFDAVHKERIDFRNEKALADWLDRRGIERSGFEGMYKSFGVQSQVARMKAMTGTYGVEGVPLFFVNGKYSTEPHRAGGERQVVDLIDQLIARERSSGR